MTDRGRLGSFLKNVDVYSYIMRSAKRALGGQTPTALRQYSFSCDEVAKTILFRAEVERELTEDEREDLAVAETEIYADFADDTLVETVVEVVLLGMPLHPLPGGIVFLREGEHAPQLPKSL